MPDARSSNFNGRSQGGSNADNVLADAFVKGVRGAVNWADGYSAMVQNAEVQPPNNKDPQASDSSDKEGRGALPDWIKYGYITPSYTRAVSRAIEYSANDFALHQVASGQGNGAGAAKYLDRSRNWRNHWNPDASSLNFNGFIVPLMDLSYLKIQILGRSLRNLVPFSECFLSCFDFRDVSYELRLPGNGNTDFEFCFSGGCYWGDAFYGRFLSFHSLF